MAEIATLARPYANAVFAAAKEHGELDRWSRMLQFLATAAADPQVQTLLEAPEVSDEQKAFRLVDICSDELNDRGRKFVRVLAENKRLALLGEVADQFEALRAQEQKSLDVDITSAFPLSGEEEARIRSALIRRFDREIQLTSQVDPSLIGGAVIRAGDTVIDGSVHGKLQKLAESILRT